jgi:outer membrane protein assembly factor BamD (BamD/ComL family)
MRDSHVIHDKRSGALRNDFIRFGTREVTQKSNWGHLPTAVSLNQSNTKKLPKHLAVALVVAVVVVSCGRDRFVHRWNDQVLATGNLQDSGALDKAETRYLQLLENAPDDDARRYVLNELAAISEERGDWKQAIERYEQVWSEPADDEAGAHALYRSAVIVIRHLNATERGLALHRKTIERYPASVSAEFSARDLADHFRRQGDYEAMRADFDALYERAKGTEVGDNVLFAVAQTLELDAEDEGAALPYYKKLYTNYPDGGLADDALWQAAMIYHRRQHWQPANELLTRLADNVETSWFVGSYNSPWANDARFTLGLTYLLYLDDYQDAVAHFERYIDDFPTSLDTDDAAWNIVQAYRLMGEDDADKNERYRDSLRQFAEDYPESRYVREVEERLAEVTSQ